MINRRVFGSAAAFGAMALTAVATGTGIAEATSRSPWVPMPDPATTPVPNPPFAKDLTREERRNLETFDELDFEIFTHEKWDRIGESHARHIRVHWPDGHYTDGIDKHIQDLKALFVWAPDTRITRTTCVSPRAG